MKTSNVLRRLCASLVACLLLAGAWGCSNEVDGPTPKANDVTPEVVCFERDTWVEVGGEGFSPSAVDALSDEQKMALPMVTLMLTAEIDGTDFPQSTDWVLNPDPTDPDNLRVRWSSLKKLSFFVDEALALRQGIYDIRVKNPTGGENTKVRAFTAVPPPVVTSAIPTPICTEQYENEIVISGDWFLKIGEALPTVHIDGVDFTPTAMEGCQEVVTPRGDVQRCDTIRVTVGVDAVGVGAHSVTVTNPEPAHCTSSEPVTLHILPRPTVNEAVEHPICVEQGERPLTIHGVDFLIIDGVEPTVTIGGVAVVVNDVTGCADIEGLPTTVTCTTIDVTVAEDLLEPGVHTVVVHNPVSAQCVSTDAVTITVAPAPSLITLVPQPICTAQGENVLLLTGAGFLQIGDALPTLTIGGVVVPDFVLGGCAPLEGTDDTVTCTELTITLDQGEVEPGLHDVIVENPLPAGCDSTFEGMTPENSVRLAVVPEPTLAAIEPNPICLAQQDMTMTLTGAGFLRIGAELPVVTIGTVELTDIVLTEDTCVPVPGVADAVSCTELTGQLPMGVLAAEGSYLVTLTNPDPAGCHSTESVLLEVAPPPDVTAVTPTELCTGGGFFTITGTELEGVYAYLVDADGGEVHPSSISVNETGTEAVIAFGAGLRPSVYSLHVTGRGGCVDSLTAAITVTLGPVVYYMDPPTTYNGIAIRGTIYVSALSSAPGSVTIAPAGGGTEIPLGDVAWDPLRPNRILATIPAGLDAGVYDVFVRGVSGCDAFLANGLTVVGETAIALLDPAMDPQFGHEMTNVAVNILAKADADLLAGEVNFLATPRAYLSNTSLLVAEPLAAVVFDSSSQLSAVVPPLPAGSYDLVVINPGIPATVGFAAGAYRAMEIAPPVIDDVAPTKIETSAGQTIFVNGANFFNAAVSLECSDGSTPGAVIVTAESTTTKLEVTVDGSGTQHGSVCVVRVTNTVDGTFDDWSAISLTNPAGNLSPFSPGAHSLEEGRRAPGVAIGRATRKSRFLYAIAGDDGTPAGAKTSVELSPLGRFGEVGAWRPAHNALPAARTLAMAKQLGSFIYLIGGLDDTGAASNHIYRARILDPLMVPEIVDLNIAFSPTGTGLEAGAWTYVVSAVYAATDTDNPGGETLPSEAITLYAPDVPDGVEVSLTWDTVYGADLVTPAVEYRVYRTLTVNGAHDSMRLLAVVPGTANPTHAFTDTNPAAFEDETKSPLAIGSLGEWHRHGQLNTPRAAYGFIDVTEYAAAGEEQGETGCTNYWYVFGGITNAATESLTYEAIPLIGQMLGAPAQFTAGGTISARRDLSVWVATEGNSKAVNLNTCEFYFYVGPGASGPLATPTAQSTVRVTKYALAPNGQLPNFAQAMTAPAPVDYQGYAAFWSGTFAYALGGRQNGFITNTANDATWSLGAEPNLSNWNNAANNLTLARYQYGYTRTGAFVYIVGGLTTGNVVTDSCEYNVR